MKEKFPGIEKNALFANKIFVCGYYTFLCTSLTFYDIIYAFSTYLLSSTLTRIDCPTLMKSGTRTFAPEFSKAG